MLRRHDAMPRPAEPPQITRCQIAWDQASGGEQRQNAPGMGCDHRIVEGLALMPGAGTLDCLSLGSEGNVFVRVACSDRRLLEVPGICRDIALGRETAPVLRAIT